MKLHLTKNQTTKLLGGVKFEVKAKVVLTHEESELVRRYKLQNEMLVSRKMSSMLGELTQGRAEISITVNRLISGDTYKCKDLNEVMIYSSQLVDACETLKTYLEMARDFGGEEVIEFNLQTRGQSNV